MMLCGVGFSGKKKDKSLRYSPTSSKANLTSDPSEKPRSGAVDKKKILTEKKWLSCFDLEGRLTNLPRCFRAILDGGVEPSIRPQVWEFLLGCYSIHSTRRERDVIREARRARYAEILSQCSLMDSSVGSGRLPDSVGSKKYDVRAKDSPHVQAVVREAHVRVMMDAQKKSGADCATSNTPGPIMEAEAREKGKLGHRRHQAAWASVESINYWGEDEGEVEKGEQMGDSWSDFSEEEEGPTLECIREEGFSLSRFDGFTVFADLLPEQDSVGSSLYGNPPPLERSGEGSSPLHATGVGAEEVIQTREQGREEKVLRSREEVGEAQVWAVDPVVALGLASTESSVAEWLFTLHKIAVDVVRTDQDLGFFQEASNMARVGDILAVHAWIDPETGFCQGMCDILSPFVVLFQNDADAFWCFQCLMSRIRHNFMADGPVGVMRQLAALRTILALSEEVLLQRLMAVGADDFMFAFRMLLVMFRREMPLDRALTFWEMMWVADFDPLQSQALLQNPPRALYIDLPQNPAFSVEEILSVSEEPQGPLFKGVWRSSGATQKAPIVSKWGQFRDGDEDISVFCVAAILHQNRDALLRELDETDDALEVFKNVDLKIDLRTCVQSAIKLRATYFLQLKNLPKNLPYMQVAVTEG